MKEVFKPFPGYTLSLSDEPLFYVSNLGRIRSHRYSETYIISTNVNTSGYEYHQFMYNGKRISLLVHRMVTIAHIGECPEKHEVNHKDGDKLNNRLDNLEYVTRSDNIKHAVSIGLKKVKSGEEHYLYGQTGANHPKSQRIEQYDLANNHLNTYGGMREAARAVKGNASHISKCIKDNKPAYGFIWKKQLLENSNTN